MTAAKTHERIALRTSSEVKEMLTLTPRDWNVFAKALDKLDRPRPKLSAAMKRHRQWQETRQAKS